MEPGSTWDLFGLYTTLSLYKGTCVCFRLVFVGEKFDGFSVRHVEEKVTCKSWRDHLYLAMTITTTGIVGVYFPPSYPKELNTWKTFKTVY